ncbi:MAG: glycosyltransferase family 39 protein [Anaerolineae bacterium]|nr:glycosyltransferase family 39 protein [Anaerolineae bacterium]
MRRLLTAHRRLLVLLALFVIAVLIHQMTLPTLEGSDETLHLNYVNLLRNENRLPDRATYLTNSTWQESGQPPLGYWVAAQFLRLFNLPNLPDDLLQRLTPVSNHWFTPPDRWNYRDNFNLFYHGLDERAFGHPEVVINNRVARLPSLLFGSLAVIGAYGAAREVFRRNNWALVATAIFAFTPQMVAISASVTNDVSSTAFATLAIWQTLRLLRVGASPLRLAIIGALLALGGLSKVSALLIAPGLGLAILFDWRQRRLPFRQLVINGLIVGVVLALILGPWIVYGVTTFNDPFGFRTHNNPLRANIVPTLGQFVRALPEAYLSYWGKLGTSAIWLSPLLYALFSVIPILSVVGYVAYFVRLRGWPHPLPPSPLRSEGEPVDDDSPRCLRRGVGGEVNKYQAIVLIVIGLCVFAGLLQWLRELFAIAYVITGRLMYAGHVAVAIGLTGGLYLLALTPNPSPSGEGSRRPPVPPLHFVERRAGGEANKGAIYAVTLLAAASLIVAPLRLHTAFAPPHMLTQQQLPALEGGPIDFDQTIRFLGYTRPDLHVYQGRLHRITLCWQVLKPATHAAAFALKFFESPTVTVGERTSVHGLGHYPSALWRAGDIFCDDVDVPISGIIEPGRVYNMILTLMDAQTMAANWPATLPPNHTPVQYPFIGQVIGAK